MSDQEKVLVPALVGLEVGDAHELAFSARVVAVAADPAIPLPVAGIVTAQDPGAGTRVEPAHPVVIAVNPPGPPDGGGGGDDDGGDGGGGGGGGRPITPPPPGPRDPAGTKPVG